MSECPHRSADGRKCCADHGRVVSEKTERVLAEWIRTARALLEEFARDVSRYPADDLAGLERRVREFLGPTV